MAPPKLYLDENLSSALAEALRKKGFDAIHTQLAVDWWRSGKEHWGIIVSPQRSFRETLRRLTKLLEATQAEELKSQLRYL